MTTHDAATRERVESAIYAAWDAQGGTLNDIGRRHLSRIAADAALSARLPPPTGWEVSEKSLGAFNAAYNAAGGNILNSRMCAMRAAVPHLLRDLADGVSIDCLRKAWLEVFGEENGGGNLRDLLRSLAETLEGKA